MADEGPRSADSEAAVVGQLLARPKLLPHVVKALEPGHFAEPGYRLLYEGINDAYWAQDPIEAGLIAEQHRPQLARIWKVEEEQVVTVVRQLLDSYRGGSSDSVTRHADVVKRHFHRRVLLDVSGEIRRRVDEGDDPTVVASELGRVALGVATTTGHESEWLHYSDLGRRYIREQRKLRAAFEAGIEIGAYFGYAFIDHYLRGLRGGELMFLAGPPGSGKSAVGWTLADGFADRQLKKPAEDRIGTGVLSLEMPEEPSSQRLAQSLTGIDGGRLREGRTDDADLQLIVDNWAARKELPLWFNHGSRMRCSQLRAQIVDAMRMHKIGLVVIDHWKYLEPDRQFRNPLDADEYKAGFLKQEIAVQLNVAVICLAHTTKAADARDGGRPRMADLYGAQWIAAHADWIAFVHRPYKFATEEQIESGDVQRTDAEMIWEKCRHMADNLASKFYFDPSRMLVTG